MSNNEHTAGGSRGALGDLLRGAREAKGLELREVAALTHVRAEYLKALEDEAFHLLPESVYTRNFVKQYALAVDLAADEAVQLYNEEHATRVGQPIPAAATPAVTATPKVAAPRQTGGIPTAVRETSTTPTPKPGVERATTGRPLVQRIMPTVLMLALLLVLVGGTVWGLQRLLFPSTPRQTVTETQTDTTPSTTVAESTVLFSIDTDPPGATVAIDGFLLPGVTPITNAPVSAQQRRTLRVSLAGYEPYEATVDLQTTQSLTLTLEPEDAPPVRASNILNIEINDTTWIEVYQSGARDEGERLLYRIAEPGERFEFELPVYVHLGNASGVRIGVGDEALEPFDSSGGVMGRAYR